MLIHQNKAALRSQFESIRAAIPIEDREKASLAAATLLASQTLFQKSQHVACYLPFKNEFEPTPIIKALWQANKRCYLPVVSLDKNAYLSFVIYTPQTKLITNRYGILEPESAEKKMVVTDLDLVITPLLAFDLRGHRLGTGGGYYDKTFSFLTNPSQQKPFLLGLGYAAQGVQTLPHDEWDIRLAGCLTEKEIIYF